MNPPDRTDAVLASIDGALADEDLPDAMRWSPTPDRTRHPVPWHTEDGASFIEGTLPGLLDRLRADRIRWAVVHRPLPPVPVRGEVVQRNGWRMVDNRYPPAPVVPARIAAGLGVPWSAVAVEVSSEVARVMERFRAMVSSEEFVTSWQALMDRVRQQGVSIGQAFSQASRALVSAGVIPEPLPPTSDPRARALAHRSRLGAGPDRQVQHQHRPRRHS